MDSSIPAGAAVVLDFIRKTEVGRADQAGYDVIYGHNQDKLAKPLTKMTLAQVQAAQSGWTKRFGSSAAGGYQFMRATLKGLMDELKLSPSQLLDADLQDRLGYHLLKRRGFLEFVTGEITRTEFGKRLAMEWASFPVLESVKGAHRSLMRGQSYYAGDGLNKALLSPAAIEALLDQVKKATTRPPVTIEVEKPVVQDPEALDKPMAKSKTVWSYLTVIVAAIASIFERLDFINLDWRVQIFMLAVVIGLAGYGIKRRRDIAVVYRDLKSQFGGA